MATNLHFWMVKKIKRGIVFHDTGKLYKFKFQCLQMKFYWNTIPFIHCMSSCGAFRQADLSYIYYLDLQRMFHDFWARKFCSFSNTSIFFHTISQMNELGEGDFNECSQCVWAQIKQVSHPYEAEFSTMHSAIRKILPQKGCWNVH